MRTRLQIHDCSAKDYKLMKTIQHIFKTEGGVLSLYRGLSANLLGSGVNWGLYFFSYEQFKRLFSNHSNSNKNNTEDHSLSSRHHFMAGTLSGMIAISCTNPIWCIKTRLQIDQSYHGLFDCLKRIYREEGILRFYRGLGPAYILVLNPALQFTFYEQLKCWFTDLHLYYDESSCVELGSTDYLIMGAMAKMMSSSTVYPLQLIRSRLFQTQTVVSNSSVSMAVAQNKYCGVYDCFNRIIVKEGVLGFYKGLSINLVKTVPCSALTFMFYENTLKILNKYTL